MATMFALLSLALFAAIYAGMLNGLLTIGRKSELAPVTVRARHRRGSKKDILW